MGSTTIIAAILNLLIMIVFVTKFEIYAACFSMLIANLLVYFYRRKKLKKYLKLKELKWKGPMLFLAIICLAYYTKYIAEISN